MAFKYLTGSLMNLITRGQPYGAAPSGPIVNSGSFDVNYPLVNMWDGFPALAARWSGPITWDSIQFANNLVRNGDFEQGTVGWSAVACTFTSESGGGNIYKGAKSAKCVNTSGFGRIVAEPITVQAGEWLQIRAAAKSDGVNTAYLTLSCLETNKSLNGAGAWTSPGGGVWSKTGNTMTAFTPVAFQVPTFAELGKATATLQIALLGQQNGMTHYWDEVLLIPAIDFIGAFGHGFDASTGLALWDSGASYWHSGTGSFYLVGDASNAAFKNQPAIATAANRVYDPFPVVGFYIGATAGSVTSTVAPWVGELVVGQTRTVPMKNPNTFSIGSVYKGQQRSETRSGSTWVYNANKFPVREARISIRNSLYSQSTAEEQEWLKMTEGGLYPIILLPQDIDTSLALYGRITDTMAFSYDAPYGQLSTTTVTIIEEPFPNF
jgi:hypothetical protein